MIRQARKWKDHNIHKRSEVLIVEKDSASTLAIKEILERNKIEFDSVKNGIIAVEKYEKAMRDQESYKLIIIELDIPLMSGFEATKKIREIEIKKNYAHSKIWGFSESNDINTVEICKDSGIDNYLSKPFNFEQVQELIDLQVPPA